jgi:hypothetical protein
VGGVAAGDRARSRAGSALTRVSAGATACGFAGLRGRSIAPNGSGCGESDVCRSSEPNRHLGQELVREDGRGAWLPFRSRTSKPDRSARSRLRTAVSGERIAHRPKRSERTALANELSDASARPAMQVGANSDRPVGRARVVLRSALGGCGRRADELGP